MISVKRAYHVGANAVRCSGCGGAKTAVSRLNCTGMHFVSRLFTASAQFSVSLACIVEVLSLDRPGTTFRRAMRLKDSDKNAILQQTSRFAPDGEAYLFGSRTNSAARGGDIDLLLLTETKLPLRLIREMRRAILSKIGEQKLDIVNFSKQEQHPFKEIAMERALKL